MARLVEVYAAGDILPVYRGSPIERLLRLHNLGQPPAGRPPGPELFIVTCITHRLSLSLPNEFAYVLRTAGTRLEGNEFELLYAVAVGGVSAVALIAHTVCGMEHILEKRDAFIAGLVPRGIAPDEAAAHFDAQAGRHAIQNPVEAVLVQTAYARSLLPRMVIAPLLYRVENNRLAQIAER